MWGIRASKVAFSNCYLFFKYQQIDKNPITTDGAILLMKVLDKSDMSAMTDVHLAVSVCLILTLKEPPTICSRRQFQILLLFENNK